MEYAIELQNVSKTFKNFKIEDLSLQINKGFVTGFIGANGAGKSTVIRMMLNLLQPDRGEVRVLGMDYAENEKQIKERIGFVFNDATFYEDLTLRDMKKLIAPSYKRWDEQLFQQYQDKFKLPLNQAMRSFSDGMKMKASLALALSHHAELLILDEPTSNLDPIFRRELIEVLHDIMLDEEKTILFSTHIMSDLSPLADYITFIDNGKIIFSKGIHELEEDYVLIRGGIDLLDRDTEKYLLGIKRTNHQFEALASNDENVIALFGDEVVVEKPSLEEIMYFSRGGSLENVALN